MNFNVSTIMVRIKFNFDDFVKSPSAVRQAHGPEQSRRAALHFIATTKSTKGHEEKNKKSVCLP
jgi:hypothetical protein